MSVGLAAAGRDLEGELLHGHHHALRIACQQWSYMQCVADSIVIILEANGIDAYMYLDELIVVAPSRDIAITQYDVIRGLFAELGLLEVKEKSQPPSQVITWLGVTIDVQCPKLRVHSAPGVHISTAGCTILGGVHPVCARFFEPFIVAIYWEGAWTLMWHRVY